MRREVFGYDRPAVDAFLARCLATPGVYRSAFPQLRDRVPGGERVTAAEVREVRFRPAVLGYSIRQVDALLDELEQALERTRWQPPLPDARPHVISLVDAEDLVAAERP